MQKILRVGVIGVGAMGQNHARVYSQLKGVKLVGVSDVDEAQVDSISKKYNCKGYLNYKELLNENLDAVSITVPTTLHKKVALDAINKSVNILIEKPIASILKDADKIIETAQKKGIKLMVGHIERFNPAVIKLKELINNGDLGDVISVSAKRVGPYPPRIKDIGIILELGTHDIDIISYLYEEKVKEVYAYSKNVFHKFEDQAVILMKLNNDCSGIIETNWLTPHKVRALKVTGSKGIAEVDYIQSTLRLLDKEWIRDAKIEKVEPLKLELTHFIDCIRENREPLVSGYVGKHALEVALAAVESSRTGKVCCI